MSYPGPPSAEGYWEPFPLPYSPPELPSPWKGARNNVIFFLLTVASIFGVGWYQYRAAYGLSGAVRLLTAVMSILMSHEMGHYLACRYYRVDATLPYFIPFPLPIHPVGTFGAFIRIRSRFPHRKALFDIGIAGPLAGFVVCLPVLVLGLMEAKVMPIPAESGGTLAEPLGFQWLASIVIGAIPEGYTLFIGPLGMAAWFGLLMTALNLMPIGQLDGGHVVYAILGRRSVWVSRAGLAVMLLLLYLQPTWLLWTILLLVFMRRPHPATVNDSAPLGVARIVVALIGLGVFVVSFTSNPFNVSWSEFAEAWRQLFVWLASWLT